RCPALLEIDDIRGISSVELGQLVRDSEERRKFYQAIATAAGKAGDKIVLYRANRLFERTPLMLSESDSVMERLSQLPADYLEITYPILSSDKFLRLRAFQHHQNTSTFTHSLEVSLRAYQMAKKKGLDCRAAAIGGLLHDYYLYDWHFCDLKWGGDGGVGFFELHFFTHGFTAAENAARDFPELVGSDCNDKVRNIISSHIPFGHLAPHRHRVEKTALSKEAHIVRRCDMISSLDIIKNPLKNIGIDSSSLLDKSNHSNQ
ncbi:HD domain-containing protein, partial [Candidatus Saccharibacteria bacterium]|nr:HD domain-containing protein [Candidatus Saccharibacteria bacterium]